jgi:hypothetical protein
MVTMPQFLHMARFNFYKSIIVGFVFMYCTLISICILSLFCLLFKTGSGKTYTMGTNYTGEGSNSGVIPKVVENIFKRVEATKDSTEFLIRVSFIEVKDASSYVINFCFFILMLDFICGMWFLMTDIQGRSV